jgi:hypothetical protein
MHSVNDIAEMLKAVADGRALACCRFQQKTRGALVSEIFNFKEALDDGAEAIIFGAMKSGARMEI